MTVAELKEILEHFEDTDEVCVFVAEHSTIYDVVDACPNGPFIQLNAE